MKPIIGVVILALVLSMAFAQVAFAAQPPDKQSKAQADKKVDAADSAAEDGTTEDVNDVGHIPCTIDHKGNTITVDIHALAGHARHGDIIDEATDCQLPTAGEAASSTSDQPGGTTPEDSAHASSGEETTPTPATSPQTVQTCDGGSTQLTADENKVLKLHNEVRKKQGLQELCVDPTLEKAARANSKAMIKKGSSSDQKSTNAKSTDTRMKNSNVSGENVASASGSSSKSEKVFDSWMKSSQGKNKILNKDYQKVGVGVASDHPKKGAKKTVYTVHY
ncbi:MAG: CAP domain-containing protein, partial [Actinobacteria bacterium]|nr:CAP domain-containing protein [Actinomycetota bacterium]